MERISLADALVSGDLELFIQQAERDGFGVADRDAFNAMLIEASKERPQEGQTSRLPGSGCSRGK